MNHPVQPDRDLVLAALDSVIDPKSGKGLHAAGLVEGLMIGEGRAGFILEVATEDARLYAPVRDAAEQALKGVPGVEKAQVVLTSASRAAARGPAPSHTVARRSARVAEDPQAKLRAAPEAERPAFVKRVIVVASGKGGVGKSTVAVNLACAMAAQGLSVGLMDADIYGPSAPTMMGLAAKPLYEDGKLTPLMAHGVKVMSIGFIIGEGQAVPWRGPMVSSAVRQFLKDVRWGTEEAPLDVLILDLPPGTGDIHLTLLQHAAVDGAVVVSTPQEIALIDARRAIAMFSKMTPPIKVLGLVENMAYFPDPATGEPIPIFGKGGARAEAEFLSVPLLAEIPIDIALRQGGDSGVPLVVSDPDSDVAQAFIEAARVLTA